MLAREALKLMKMGKHYAEILKRFASGEITGKEAIRLSKEQKNRTDKKSLNKLKRCVKRINLEVNTMKTKTCSKKIVNKAKAKKGNSESKNLQENNLIVLTDEEKAVLGKKRLDRVSELTGESELSAYLKTGDSNQRMVELLQDQQAAAHVLCMTSLRAANEVMSFHKVYPSYMNAAARLMSM